MNFPISALFFKNKSTILLLFILLNKMEMVTCQQQGCRVGDIIYAQGQRTGHIGIECLDGSLFRAQFGICGPNGEITNHLETRSCPSVVPFCVQCGPPQPFAALCLDSPMIPNHCENSNINVMNNIDNNIGGQQQQQQMEVVPQVGVISTPTCLVGDILYRLGDEIGYRANQCLSDGRTFVGTRSICAGNNEIVQEPIQRACPDSVAPYCIQCNRRSTTTVIGRHGRFRGQQQQDDALCLNTPTIPPQCNNNLRRPFVPRGAGSRRRPGAGGIPKKHIYYPYPSNKKRNMMMMGM